MIAAADTSPLCYLVLISEVGLLPKLFDRVFVPPAVMAELLHPDAPDTVREWANGLPPWISVLEAPALIVPGLEKLQAGERETILLAGTLHAGMVLLDEKAARRAAAERGLRITGTLGVLADGASKGIVDLPAAIDRLTRTTFRCSPALLKAALDRHSAGHDR